MYVYIFVSTFTFHISIHLVNFTHPSAYISKKHRVVTKKPVGQVSQLLRASLSLIVKMGKYQSPSLSYCKD